MAARWWPELLMMDVWNGDFGRRFGAETWVLGSLSRDGSGRHE